MPPIVYSVVATLPNEDAASAYLSWLLEGVPSHVRLVQDGGATDASVWRRIDSEGRIRIMTQYRFSDRSSFDRYVREVAPALRADGMARFGPASGVQMQRSVAELLE